MENQIKNNLKTLHNKENTIWITTACTNAEPRARMKTLWEDKWTKSAQTAGTVDLISFIALETKLRHHLIFSALEEKQ
jgi:hypothetical protein